MKGKRLLSDVRAPASDGIVVNRVLPVDREDAVRGSGLPVLGENPFERVDLQ